MGHGEQALKPSDAPPPVVPVRAILLRVAISFVLLPLLLLGPAGRVDWVWAWVFLGTLLACLLANLAVLVRVNPEVILVRLRGFAGAKAWDKVLATALGTAWVLALPVAGLDARFGWSAPVPLLIQIAALVVLCFGDLMVLWAMATNKFFSRFVRIQPERGHVVVATGPYQYVRHPGYVGWMLMTLAMPLALGSLWAFLPSGIALLIMVGRTVLEDATLLSELPGYAEYALRVPYRLVPWVW
jgi:protein-S-isoprenylcysteine O-methyltransferase Ste14